MKKRITISIIILGVLLILFAIGWISFALWFAGNTFVNESQIGEMINVSTKLILYMLISFFHLLLGMFLVYIGKNIKHNQ